MCDEDDHPRLLRSSHARSSTAPTPCPKAWEDFESNIRRWNIGACFIELTTEQYVRLKKSWVGIL